jgi:hypothetical protein
MLPVGCHRAGRPRRRGCGRGGGSRR